MSALRLARTSRSLISPQRYYRATANVKRALASDEAPFSEGHANNKAKPNPVPNSDSQSAVEIKRGRKEQDLSAGREHKSRDQAKQDHARFQPGLGKGAEQVGTKQRAEPHEGPSGSEPAQK